MYTSLVFSESLECVACRGLTSNGHDSLCLLSGQLLCILTVSQIAHLLQLLFFLFTHANLGSGEGREERGVEGEGSEGWGGGGEGEGREERGVEGEGGGE